MNEEPKWKWPSAGTVSVVFITPSLVYHMHFALDLSSVLDRAVAEFLISEVAKKEEHSWIDVGGEAYANHEALIDDMLCGEADESAQLPTESILTFKHQVSNVTHLSTQHYKLNLEKADQLTTAKELSQRSQKFPGINVVDATLDKVAYHLKQDESGAWQLPTKGVFEFDLVTVEHKVSQHSYPTYVLKPIEAILALPRSANQQAMAT